MRKRKTIKKSEDEDSSEVADEPEEFQDSGEDWTPDASAVNTFLKYIFVLFTFGFGFPSILKLFCAYCHIYLSRMLPL